MVTRKPKKKAVKRRAKPPSTPDLYADFVARMGPDYKPGPEAVLAALYAPYGRATTHNAKLTPGVQHGGSVHGHKPLWDDKIYHPAPPFHQIITTLRPGDLVDFDGVIHRVNEDGKLERADFVEPDEDVFVWVAAICIVPSLAFFAYYFFGG